MLAATLLVVPAQAAGASALAADADAIAAVMKPHRVILLGEVHDSGVQHDLRAAALRTLVAAGARPALAFEAFDRERQADIDRARRERPRDADFLIAQASDPRSGWRWEFYRPYIELALEHGLPIIGANLSRSDAMKVATGGWPAVFDATTRRELGLDALPLELRDAHERAIAKGHCNLLPAEALPAMARAQIARDIVQARAISPYLARGVVLLAGNGHVRRDIGVAHWLPAGVLGELLTVGMLERSAEDGLPQDLRSFDRYVVTAPTPRPDPCIDLAQRLPSIPSR